MMQKVVDPLLWRAVYSYVPLGVRCGSSLTVLGVEVKNGNGGSEAHGKLAKFLGNPLDLSLPEKTLLDEDVCVISTVDQETVWLGTYGQYLEMWCID